MKTDYHYSLRFKDWKEKLLYWSNKEFSFFAWTSGNGHSYKEGPFGDYLFLGENEVAAWEKLHSPTWKVGIIGYDFKNQIENLTSTNPDFFTLPDLCFFEPDWVLKIEENGFSSSSPFPEQWLREIENQPLTQKKTTRCEVVPQLSKDEYLRHVSTIQKEILEGNTYEANFCQAYSGHFEAWDPIAAFFRLNDLSNMPFAALFKAKSKWLVSASPERFLKKTGKRIIAQPIKGTIKRAPDPIQDQINRESLFHSEKERAENLMITDLMRNDLARISETGSVQVDELFGIYPLPRVFQMISTISATLKTEVSLRQIIEATFPMGSMTGAPKISTMQIIDREERFRRGWFSGAFGWIDDRGDFDFSVVIRSIIADLDAKKLYFGVGSAITIDAFAEQEYEECALKAQAIFELISGNKS
ncbi:anthranilate synthase component I family protein [Algoriphagus sp. AK58]|uniref:anthranilate synthase component I family protein n=1 Tax=Algoriphagus sp. AK58 TaxID=1406877 RepID=UPI0016505FB1|nr:anthranilate synthase component I family protein [Algoriphagus sp. AK58]MBC6365922.1 chorismate-binding protein [Algoriphagus sp. AK58]